MKSFLWCGGKKEKVTSNLITLEPIRLIRYKSTSATIKLGQYRLKISVVYPYISLLQLPRTTNCNGCNFISCKHKVILGKKDMVKRFRNKRMHHSIFSVNTVENLDQNTYAKE